MSDQAAAIPRSKKTMLYVVLSSVIIALIVAFMIAIRPAPILLQGEVETERVDLALRVSGRVVEIHSDVGQSVTVGQKLLALSSPQLESQLATAQATLAVAQADRTRVYSTRVETIDVAKANAERAKEDTKLAKQIYDRYRQLVDKGGISQQIYDQASTSYRDALKAEEVAKANLDLVQNGSSIEEKSLADARLTQSQALLKQTQTDINELTLIAPVSGQVIVRTAEKGQLFNAGTPVFSIVNLDDVWITFNVREDFLSGLKVGDPLLVRVPALDHAQIETVVTVLNAQGQYASWRATKATGDFDLRTFEMRVKPVKPVEGLRPGMSALVLWDR